MVIGEMEIRLRADIARLQRDMDSGRRVVSNATDGMRRAADAVKMAFAGMVAGMGLSQLVAMSDAYAKYTAQLRLATLSMREYGAANADVKRIANDAQQELGATGMLYARIANGTRELGTTQKKVGEITEVVNLALKVSGAAATESASAQLQLSQAFASGTLRGEEFNAVNEAAPRLMLALADGIGVPVGQLKKMAEEGAITSQIMADVLPNALAKLREEGKQVQTISGAFTVLKNNMMEFVGVQANASGAVSALTGAIGFLAKNLTVVAGALATVIAAKLATWLVGMVSSTMAAVAANRALAAAALANAVATTQAAAVIAAAKLTEAQANVRATASSAALAAARVTELRASVLAASGAVQLEIAKNGLIPAQARSIALAQANAAALAAQAVAASAATTAALANTAALTAQAAAATIGARAMAALNATMAFFGGPIGLIITLLGAAATAWMVFGNKAKEANDKVAASLDETTTEMITRLDKQIEKLKERNRLQDQEPRLRGLKDLSEADRDGLARAKAALDANRAKPMSGQTQLDEIELLSRYETALLRVGQVQVEVQAAADRGRDNKLKDWYAQNGTAAQKMAAELEALRKQFGTIPPEMEKLVRAKYADKGAAAAIRQEITAYQALMTSIAEKIALGKLEMEGYNKKSDAQKAAAKLDAEIATGKNKLSDSSIAAARAQIAIMAAQDSSILSAANAKQAIEALNDERASDYSSAVAEAAANEALAEAFGKTKTEIEALALARMEDRLSQRFSLELDEKEVAQLEKLIAAKKRNAGALSQMDANRTGISLMTEEDKERAEHANRLVELQNYHTARSIIESEANANIAAENERHQAALADMEVRRNQEKLGMMGDSADQLYSLLKQAGMEQSALGKAAFLASKAIAVAEIIMNTQVAASKAYRQFGAYGAPAAFAITAAGYASAGIVAGLAIAEVSGGRADGGPVGAGKMYEVNERGPELLTAGGRDYLMMGSQGGNVTPNHKLGASGGDKITIINQTTGRVDSVVEQRISPTERALIIKEAVGTTAAQMADPNSNTSRSLSRNFNVPRTR